MKSGMQREAVTVKWDSRKSRYVARMKHYPAIFAYGATIPEAQENIKLAFREHVYGEARSEDKAS